MARFLNRCHEPTVSADWAKATYFKAGCEHIEQLASSANDIRKQWTYLVKQLEQAGSEE